MTTKQYLITLKNLAKNNPQDLELAKKIAAATNVYFLDEKYIGLSIEEREQGNHTIPHIIIELKDKKIEIIIQDETYSVISTSNEDYFFKKVYHYNSEKPIIEVFHIKKSTGTMDIAQIGLVGMVVIKNENITFARSHMENTSSNSLGYEEHLVKNAANSIEIDNYHYYDEVLYFPQKEDMYLVRLYKKEKEFTCSAGASLNIPKFKTDTSNLDEDRKTIFNALGMGIGSQMKTPNINFTCSYETPSGSCNAKIQIIKIKSDIIFKIEENNEVSADSIHGSDGINITLDDLYLIKDYISNKLGDKPYLTFLLSFIDELIKRLNYRLEHDFSNPISYDGDIFDFIITEGKGNHYTSAKSIEERGFDIYSGRYNMDKLFSAVKIPEVGINPSPVKTGSKK